LINNHLGVNKSCLHFKKRPFTRVFWGEKRIFVAMIEINVRKAIADARREFSDLNDKSIAVGIARAINRTLEQSKTAARREIQTVYKIRARDVNRAMIIRRAVARQIAQHGMLLAQGVKLPLIGFGARQGKRGVSVNVMGTRKLVRSAFITNMPSGGRGVYARGVYNGNEFQYRNKRLRKNGNDLPITQLTSVSVPKAMSHNTVLKHLADTINQKFPQRLTHELMRKRTGG
jgi:hypothetical protein